ncbi:MAG: hypothetical protein H6621_12380 [Halobacteriovoraceae bacterium]|nr:hypothetical protein [Halobacteriovoraceae bacterium]
MKKIFILLNLLSLPLGYSLPILNENIATDQHLTAYPDHLDKNIYYLVPKSLEIALDDSGKPLFSYREYFKRNKKRALVQAVMNAAFLDKEIASMKKDILSKNKNAKFHAITFLNSSIKETGALKDLVNEAYCNRQASVVGAEQVCSFIFNKRGVKIFRKTMKDYLSITFEFNYLLQGVLRKPDGGFDLVENRYGVVGKIGGDPLTQFPELFRDSAGELIEF